MKTYLPSSSSSSSSVLIIILSILSVIGIGTIGCVDAISRNAAGAGAASSASSSTRPQLSITIRDGNFTDIDGLDPTITWENSAILSNDVALQYGIDLSARTTNLASLPRRMWGRASRVFANRYALSARLDVDFQSMDKIDFEIDGEDDENDIKMRVIGRAAVVAASGGGGSGRRTLTSSSLFSTGSSIGHVEFTKGFENNGNRVTVNPRYNVDYRHADVVVTYDADDTLIKVTASRDDQVVTISQKINDENMISPTIGRDGSLSLAWDRKLGDSSSVRTTLNPNRSVDVEWRDAAWTANVNFPMEENDLRGATVHIKRDIKF